jgi:hypothetical protein
VEPLGVWLEAARPPVRLVVPGPGGRRLLLLAADLGLLLTATARVALWDGFDLRLVGAHALGRARRLRLPADARAADAVALSTLSPPPGRRALLSGDVTLRQPIDCVVEGPVP